MAVVVSRESYYETGLAVLADLGYGGLKLAEVCNRLRVTTGSFYHYFPGWPAYTRELVEYWMRDRVSGVIEVMRDVADPRRRIELLVERALELPHSAEAAIRVWSSLNPEVHQVQVAVDQQRFDILRESAQEIVGDARQAQVFASWAMYVLVGYEQYSLPPDPTALRWIADQVLEALTTGRFATVPDPE